MTAPTPDPTAGEGLSEAERTDLAIAVHDTDAAGCSCEAVYAAVERIVAARVSAAATRARAEALREAADETRESFEAGDETTWHAVGDWLTLCADALAPDTAGESAVPERACPSCGHRWADSMVDCPMCGTVAAGESA